MESLSKLLPRVHIRVVRQQPLEPEIAARVRLFDAVDEVEHVVAQHLERLPKSDHQEFIQKVRLMLDLMSDEPEPKTQALKLCESAFV